MAKIKSQKAKLEKVKRVLFLPYRKKKKGRRDGRALPTYVNYM
jgi:hypothetical protein